MSILSQRASHRPQDANLPDLVCDLLGLRLLLFLLLGRRLLAALASAGRVGRSSSILGGGVVVIVGRIVRSGWEVGRRHVE